MNPLLPADQFIYDFWETLKRDVVELTRDLNNFADTIERKRTAIKKNTSAVLPQTIINDMQSLAESSYLPLHNRKKSLQAQKEETRNFIEVRIQDNTSLGTQTIHSFATGLIGQEKKEEPQEDKPTVEQVLQSIAQQEEHLRSLEESYKKGTTTFIKQKNDLDASWKKVEKALSRVATEATKWKGIADEKSTSPLENPLDSYLPLQ